MVAILLHKTLDKKTRLFIEQGEKNEEQQNTHSDHSQQKLK